MARVLTCLDPVPAGDGSCAETAWVEQPGLLPPLSVKEGLTISGLFVSVMATAWAWKAIRRFVNPKMG